MFRIDFKLLQNLEPPNLLIWVAPFSPLNSSYVPNFIVNPNVPNLMFPNIKTYILYFYQPDQILRLKYAIPLPMFSSSRP